MNLVKRDCPISMKLVPYGGGWTDVYLNIGEDSLYFIISNVIGDNFTNLMSVLYFLHPYNNDPENEVSFVECWEGLIEGNKVVKIEESIEKSTGTIYRDIPKRGTFYWDEEGAGSQWIIEREPNLDTDFDIKITIDHYKEEGDKHYEYVVRYKDFCYAVAKACTEALKSNGLYGYHVSVYSDDMHLRYLLFLKCIALGNFEARELITLEEGKGEKTPLEKELELLLFDM